MGCHRLAHDLTLEHIYIYINISRAETVELRTWISQRSQRQLRPNGMLPDMYLETQTGSHTHLPTMTVKRIVRRLVRCNSDRKFRLRAALAWSRITLLLSAQARPPQTFTYVRGNTHSHIHTHMHTYMHTSIHACVHTCVHTCMPQSNIDMTHVHTHVHSRTCARMWAYKSNAALLLSNPCPRAAQCGTCASSWLDECTCQRQSWARTCVLRERADNRPRNQAKMTRTVLQCRLHQKSALEMSSKAISGQSGRSGRWGSLGVWRWP